MEGQNRETFTDLLKKSNGVGGACQAGRRSARSVPLARANPTRRALRQDRNFKCLIINHWGEGVAFISNLEKDFIPDTNRKKRVPTKAL